jgi:hypothetical protein
MYDRAHVGVTPLSFHFKAPVGRSFYQVDQLQASNSKEERSRHKQAVNTRIKNQNESRLF